MSACSVISDPPKADVVKRYEQTVYLYFFPIKFTLWQNVSFLQIWEFLKFHNKCQHSVYSNNFKLYFIIFVFIVFNSTDRFWIHLNSILCPLNSALLAPKCWPAIWQLQTASFHFDQKCYSVSVCYWNWYFSEVRVGSIEQ